MMINGSTSYNLISNSNQANQQATKKANNDWATQKILDTAASSNPAALEKSVSLQNDAQVQRMGQGSQGLALSHAALATAQSGLSSINGSLDKLQNLAIQSSDPTLSSSNRANLQTQYDSTLQNIDQTASQTNFNGQNLLDGSFSQNMGTGANGQPTNVSIGSFSSTSLGLSTTGVATPDAAQNALGSIDNAMKQVKAGQSSVAAAQDSIHANIDGAGVQAENEAAALNSKNSDLNKMASNYQQQQMQLTVQGVAQSSEKQLGESSVKTLLGMG